MLARKTDANTSIVHRLVLPGALMGYTILLIKPITEDVADKIEIHPHQFNQYQEQANENNVQPIYAPSKTNQYTNHSFILLRGINSLSLEYIP